MNISATYSGRSNFGSMKIRDSISPNKSTKGAVAEQYFETTAAYNFKQLEKNEVEFVFCLQDYIIFSKVRERHKLERVA